MAIKIFGFEIRNTKTESGSFVPPRTEDGTIDQVVGASGAAAYGYAFDVEGRFKTEAEQIQKYRSMAQTPEIDLAVEEITSESIIIEDDKPPLSLNIFAQDNEIPKNLKQTIVSEFDNVISILNLNSDGHDLFRRWYVDGRFYGHIVVDEQNIADGIKDIRPLDPRKTKKMREIVKQQGQNGLETIVGIEEYFVYSDKGVSSGDNSTGVRLSSDVLVYAPSGLLDVNNNVISFLHKAIKPYNQLRYMEDAALIYALSRAPQRQVFYIDVADMPKQKAEQYVQDIMNRYKNKIVYDAATGDLKGDQVHTSITENYWLPRRCFSMDTRVKLLDGRDLSINDISKEYHEGKKNWTYSVADDGTIVPGLITWAGVTMRDAAVVDVHLDNGEIITCTPDHKFIMRNGEKVQAQHLSAGSSLMPLYTEKKVMYGSTEYENVLDNNTNKWKPVHRMVSEYINRKSEKTEVIHHADFNRFNNNPENLVIMDKVAHFELHSKHASESWKKASPEKLATWKAKLSESGKKWFETEDGEKRKKEISALNRSQHMLDELARGRDSIKKMRKIDKETMTKEEFNAKWYSNNTAFLDSKGYKCALEQKSKDKRELSNEEYYQKWIKTGVETNKTKHLSKLQYYDMTKIKNVISNILTPMIRNPDIVNAVAEIYPEMKLEKFRAILKHNGYPTISDFICREFSGEMSQRRKYQAKNSDAKNHKVVKVVHRTDRMDVGTLTVDGNEIHHGYHNYALSAGVFVMNSSGRTTEITTLPGDNITSQMDNIMYFMNKLYSSLNLPQSRVKADQTGFNLGRASEITRDEVKFGKFISRLRLKFSEIPLQALRVQLILKGIISPEDWDFIKSKIRVEYQRDNYFAELKETEILQGRIALAEQIQPFIGSVFSMNYLKRQVFRLTDDDLMNMEEDEIEQEMEQENEQRSQPTPNKKPQSSKAGNSKSPEKKGS